MSVTDVYLNSALPYVVTLHVYCNYLSRFAHDNSHMVVFFHTVDTSIVTGICFISYKQLCPVLSVCGLRLCGGTQIACNASANSGVVFAEAYYQCYL